MPFRPSQCPPATKPPFSGSFSAAVFSHQSGVGEAEQFSLQEARVALLEPTQPNIGFDDMFVENAEEHFTIDAITAARRMPAGSGNCAVPEISVHSELAQFSESLRQEFRTSIGELRAAQTAAAEAQSDVLRFLTEAIFQSSASREVTPESLERAFAGIEERLIARIGAGAGAPKTSDHSFPAINRGAASPATEARTAKATPGPGSGNSRSWAEIRSDMISGGELSGTPAAALPEIKRELPEITRLSSDRQFQLPAQDPSLEVPATVDLDAISDIQLREAFREREEFITTLIARIRRQQETATQQLSAEQLRQLVTDLPEELAAQVRHTLKQMNDLARMGELELSLERARIARQVNQLEHSRQTIEHNARQIGLQLNPDGTIASQSGQPGGGTSSRRWLGKLGFGQ